MDRNVELVVPLVLLSLVSRVGMKQEADDICDLSEDQERNAKDDENGKVLAVI